MGDNQSSYSYPVLERIWANAVRLTRALYPNLQDEVEGLEYLIDDINDELEYFGDMRYIGPYSTIVYKDDSKIYARDKEGEIIAAGKAGVDDATVIKTAFENGGRVVVLPATYTLYFTITTTTTLITLPDNTVVDGLIPDNTKLEFYIDGSEPDAGKHFNVEEIKTGSNCAIRNLTINGNKSYFAPKDYLQYLIFCYNKSNILIENVRLFHSSRCGIVPESENMIIRNVYAEDCLMPMNGVAMHRVEVDGYTAKTCEYAFYIETGGATDVYLRNFHFEDCMQGFKSYGDLTNVVIENGKIELKDDYGARGIVAEETNRAFRIENVRIPTNPHGYCFYVEGDKLGDTVISNCKCYGYNAFHLKRCIINGGHYETNYVFLWSSDSLIKNAYLSTSYRMFHSNSHDLHFENCELNSIDDDGTVSDITYRRCTIAGSPTENSSTATLSGNGSNTQFTIAHGLYSTPNKVYVTPYSHDAASDFYVVCNASQIEVNYLSAPPSGTDNIELNWKASM